MNAQKLTETEEWQLTAYIASMWDNIDSIARGLTPHSKGRKIKSNKPKDDGIEAYVWRMARFNVGDDTTLPMMAVFDLYNGLDKIMGFNVGNEYGPNSKLIGMVARALDLFSGRCLVKLGLDPLAGVNRWAKVL